MTTPPVVSITDDLIAELEAAASDSKLNIYRPFGWAHSVRCGNHMQTDFDFLSLASPETILTLLAERADLKRQLAAASVDAERWRCARDLLHPDDIRDFQLSRVSFGMKPTEDISRQCDVAIDAAMDIGSGD